jgi:hypothetical protein
MLMTIRRAVNGRATWLAVAALLLALPCVAVATPLAPPPEQMSPQELGVWLDGGPRGARPVPEPLGPFNYVREFDQMVDFLAVWQVLDPDSTDHGGLIEAESGYLGDVIQTDNTLEAIWSWSRYRQFSGRTTFDDNVEAAWVYCTNFPAWLEEGNVGDDYYRVHNCAWALTAVLQYEASTGDTSYADYAETCADYIVAHSLDVFSGTIYQQRLNAFCKGWAAGNLYLYGEALNDPGLKSAAKRQGQDVLDWVNQSPDIYLTSEYWAMSSGTAMWGICNSVFRDDPAGGEAWLLTNAGYMDTWQNWYNVPGYDWDSAWNVAYGNAHFAVWDILDDPVYWQNGKYIADNLLSLDTDDDGGIVAETLDPVTEDMSWVSNYLIKFGVDRLMGQPPDHDVGVLRFAGLVDGQDIDPGVPIRVRVLATNFGLNSEDDAMITITGAAGDTSWTLDFAFAELETLTYRTSWIPPTEGYYTLTAESSLAGDENPGNDSVSITITIGDPAGVPEAGTDVVLGRPGTNPFRDGTAFRLALREHAQAELAIYDVRGRLVARPHEGDLPPGEHTITWDGRDGTRRDLPSGVYLYRLEAGGVARSGKLVKIR